MSYRFFAVVLICGLVLSGCSSTDDTLYFDDFVLSTHTIINTDTNQDGWHYIIENKRNETWDFLTIQKAAIDEDADHSIRVKSNTQSLQQRYPQVVLWELQQYTMVCWDEDIIATAIESSFSPWDDKDPLYFVQYFFIHEDVAYALMYSSPREKSATRYTKLFADIECRLP